MAELALLQQQTIILIGFATSKPSLKSVTSVTQVAANYSNNSAVQGP